MLTKDGQLVFIVFTFSAISLDNYSVVDGKESSSLQLLISCLAVLVIDQYEKSRLEEMKLWPSEFRSYFKVEKNKKIDKLPFS